MLPMTQTAGGASQSSQPGGQVQDDLQRMNNAQKEVSEQNERILAAVSAEI
jgi:hypothetical protein